MTEEFITEQMKELAKMIDYSYDDISYLSKAMHCQIVHSPSDGKNRKNYINDNYATFGDAILKFVLTEVLFNKGYEKDEITTKRQDLESNNVLCDLRRESGILKYAYNDYCFSNSAPLEYQVPCPKHDVYIEAIIAAIYKDKGMDYCKEWIISFYQKHNFLIDWN